MAKSMFSQSWYRVAEMVPRLRSHLEIHRQQFRGDVWYVMQDHQTGRYHRLSPSGYLMLCLMDGRRSMGEIWELLGKRLGSEQPTQDECIALLTQLHMSDLLAGNIPPDLAELDYRFHKSNLQRVMMHIRNPLALRVPLFDPDRFLELTQGLVAPCFTPVGFFLWVVLVGAAAVTAGIHWPALTSNLADRVLTAQNAFLIVMVYPFVKALHELGHGYAVKRWGGEVHQIGIMFLVLMPVPYVDASSALAFGDKIRRAIVGSAGIMVELAQAAIAIFVWISVEDGWVRAIAFNVILIGGVSTLFFNGNPLLRFDGYYVVCDLLEIPNLGSRANKYILYLIQKYGLGLADAESPVTASGERFWFITYAVASFVYRLFVMVGIALFIAKKLFFVGIALAVWAIVNMALLPVFKGLKFLATSPKLRGNRDRAFTALGATVLAALVLLFVVPVPYATIVQGVVWAPPNTQVRAETDGVIKAILAPPNSVVEAGTPLIALGNPELAGRLRILEAQRQEFEIRLVASLVEDQVQAELIRTQIANIDGEVASIRDKLDKLTVTAPTGGNFILPQSSDLVDRYVTKGDQLGVISKPEAPLVRLVVIQDEVDLISSRSKSLALRFADDLGTVWPARLVGTAPSAIDQLPSKTLSKPFGGAVLVDPTDGSGLKPIKSVFRFDVRPTAPDAKAPMGSRAYVRFDHGTEPVFWRIARQVRQLLLAMFNV